MATKKATKKSTAAKAASTKSASSRKATATTVAEKPVLTKSAATSGQVIKKLRLPLNIPNIMLAEALGTFVLTLVAVASIALGELFVGLAFAVIVLAIGGISGSHLNPAVTFGFWTMRKINWATGLMYWAAQFVGSLLALAVMFLVSNNTMSMNFSSIALFDWSLFAVELVAAAVFMFGITAAVTRTSLGVTSRAVVIGLSLTAALVAGSSLLTASKEGAYAAYQDEADKIAQNADAEGTEQPKTPRALLIRGVVANPAVALAVKEVSEDQLMGGQAPAGESLANRFTLDLILGTLIGAALGGNLYLLIARRSE
ncbi:hypothetical protein EOL73_00550 [Candidatus Saccharibacteria bacterium]|nr:hypothetical protein [Candidatus Saccharibacteria bacterium]NCU40232.1 hypothetical protein [Candidatus Saccharibacteria bacterium]